MALGVKLLHQPQYLQTFQEDGQNIKDRFKFYRSNIFNWLLTLEDVLCGTTIVLENVLLGLVKVVVARWAGLKLCRTENQLEVVNVLGPSLGAWNASLLPVPPPLPEVGG